MPPFKGVFKGLGETSKVRIGSPAEASMPWEREVAPFRYPLETSLSDPTSPWIYSFPESLRDGARYDLTGASAPHAPFSDPLRGLGYFRSPRELPGAPSRLSDVPRIHPDSPPEALNASLRHFWEGARDGLLHLARALYEYWAYRPVGGFTLMAFAPRGNIEGKARRALEKFGYSAPEAEAFLHRLAEKSAGETAYAYAALPAALTALAKTDWTLPQRQEILTLLVESEGVAAKLGFQELPNALAAIEKMPWTTAQTHQLLLHLTRHGAGSAWNAYQNLHLFLETLQEMKWSPDQKYQFSIYVAGKATSGMAQAFRYFPHVKWIWGKLATPLQQYTLLTSIVDKAGARTGAAYKALDAAWISVSAMGWSFERMCEFLGHVAEKAEESVQYAYASLGYATDAIKAIPWHPEEKHQLLLLLVDKAGNNVNFAYEKLPAVIRSLETTAWNWNQKRAFISNLAERGLESTGAAFSFLEKLEGYAPGRLEATSNDFLRLLAVLTSYNRPKVLRYLKNNHDLFVQIGQKYFPEHLSLYVEAMTRWPRLSFNILEGLLEATEQGIIPHELGAHREKIIRFIQETHGFIPSMYRAYLEKGDAFFPELKGYVRRILEDQFSAEEMQALTRQYDKEFVLGLVQMASPLSGITAMAKAEQLKLMEAVLAEGDRRQDVPEEWRGRTETFELPQGSWTLRAGEKSDSTGKISEILSQMRQPDGEKEALERELDASLAAYLKSDRGKAARQGVQNALFRLAAHHPELRERAELAQGLEYDLLLVLEQLFKDKDELPQLLAASLAKVAPELPSRPAQAQDIRNLPSLIAHLNRVWDQPMPPDKRLAVLASVLRPIEPGKIEEQLLSHSGLSDELKSAIREAVGLPPTFNRFELMQEILSESLQLVEQEKAKFQYREEHTVTVGLRAVKGPAFGLYGLNAGVCVAADVMLWRDSNFKLLAIVDEKQNRALGYVQVYETIHNGRKVLTIPGIHPSTEFLATVDAKRLYDPLVEKLKVFAEAGGYDAIYIPIDPNLHSNRKDIQKQIQRAGYRVEDITEVHWNYLPNPYPFSKVYVVWERPQGPTAQGQGSVTSARAEKPPVSGWIYREQKIEDGSAVFVDENGRHEVLLPGATSKFSAAQGVELTFEVPIAKKGYFFSYSRKDEAEEVWTRSNPEANFKYLRPGKSLLIPGNMDALEIEIVSRMNGIRRRMSFYSAGRVRELAIRELVKRAERLYEDFAAEAAKDARAEGFATRAEALEKETARLEDDVLEGRSIHVPGKPYRSLGKLYEEADGLDRQIERLRMGKLHLLVATSGLHLLTLVQETADPVLLKAYHGFMEKIRAPQQASSAILREEYLGLFKQVFRRSADLTLGKNKKPAPPELYSELDRIVDGLEELNLLGGGLSTETVHLFTGEAVSFYQLFSSPFKSPLSFDPRLIGNKRHLLLGAHPTAESYLLTMAHNLKGYREVFGKDAELLFNQKARRVSELKVPRHAGSDQLRSTGYYLAVEKGKHEYQNGIQIALYDASYSPEKYDATGKRKPEQHIAKVGIHFGPDRALRIVNIQGATPFYRGKADRKNGVSWILGGAYATDMLVAAAILWGQEAGFTKIEGIRDSAQTASQDEVRRREGKKPPFYDDLFLRFDFQEPPKDPIKDSDDYWSLDLAHLPNDYFAHVLVRGRKKINEHGKVMNLRAKQSKKIPADPNAPPVLAFQNTVVPALRGLAWVELPQPDAAQRSAP